MHNSLIILNRSTGKTILFSYAALSLLIFCVPNIQAQNVLLESTLVRCHEESDGVPKDPIRLATSSQGQTLDLKVFSTCRKKLLITLRITESTRNFVPTALILIDRAKNTLTQKPSSFGRPIAVKFHQEKLFQKYHLDYLYHVNGKMWEEVINSENSKNYAACNNSLQTSKPTCGFIHGTSEVTGFCCSCKDHKGNVQQRSGHRCDVPGKTPNLLTSAHCLRSSPFTYNVYKMSPPTIYQKVSFEVFKSKQNLNGTISWEQLSHTKFGVTVDSDNLVNVSGDVKVSYRAHSEGIAASATIFDASDQRLLIPLPNPFVKPENYDEPLKGPIEDRILIVPKSLMAPNGLSCNRVGTRLQAFISQQEPCRQERNSCLNNQPFDLWKQDQGPKGAPKSKFRLKSFGNVNPQLPMNFSDNFLTGHLFMEHKADAPTYVDIEIPADDLIIHSPGYNAFIENVLTDTGSDGANIVTQVMNKELVEAFFSVNLVHCTVNITQNLKTPQSKIGPLNSKTYHMNLHPYKITDVTHCVVVLINEHGENIAAREVILHPHQTCICVHYCKCVCGEKSNLKCERLPDDNLIAAGLGSEVKTEVQLDAEEKLHSQQRSKRIFHWVLIVHVFIISLSIMGALKALLGLCCCRPLALFGMEYFQEKLGASRNPTNRDIFCYNLSFFLFSPLILCWWIGRRGDSNKEGKGSSSTSSGSEEEEEGDDDYEEGMGEYDYFDNSKGSGEESDVTLFKKRSSSKNLPTLKSRTDTQSAKTSLRKSRGAISEASGISSKSKILLSAKGSPLNESAEPRYMNNQERQHKMQQLKNVTAGFSDRSIRVKPAPSPIHLSGKGGRGPQAVRSSDFREEVNNNNSTYTFFNTVSASSSRSSFGTWHRRKREQYSAYDFLPASKSPIKGTN
ncbi:Protein HAPLESS 2-B [Orchesella cincta]|uniref:Protein HAPLESS 2-B n=1 Tax=Orchesella cincta TaxID=48709 RepID=A0A1D2NJF4_ORCCI|nr:Protein HAPLESS 2-B [Orchesella cincta]